MEERSLVKYDESDGDNNNNGNNESSLALIPHVNYNNSNNQTSIHGGRRRILVKERSINAGLDFKFETVPPQNMDDLQDIMSRDEFMDCMTRINDIMRPGRSTKLDGALLVTGPLMVPLAIWGVRHSRQVKRRKRLFQSALDEFNTNHPDLYMQWNKNRMGGSVLTIERRNESNHKTTTHNMTIHTQHNETSKDNSASALTYSRDSLKQNDSIPTSSNFFV